MSRARSTHSHVSFAVGVLVAAAQFLASLVYTQTFPFQKYTTAEGLSHAAVRKVFQDSRGLLWFGTQRGVDSYDGRKFTEHLQSGSIPCPVHDIFEDRSGSLWIATYGSGLRQLLPAGPRNLLQAYSDSCLQHNVTAIAGDSLGNIWIGSDDGLFVLPHDNRRFHIEGFEQAGEIYAIAVDANRTVWVGAQGGLYTGHAGSTPDVTFRIILRRPTRSLLLLRNGDMLAGASGGNDDRYGFVCRFRGGTHDTLLSYPMTKSLIKPQSLLEDVEGTLWIGTEYGLYMIKDRKVTHLRTQNGLQNENIYDIMQDREGTMWFGTENGVLKLARPIVINYGMKEGLTGYVVLSGLKSRDGALWCGMWNGLNRIDPQGLVSHWDQASGLPHHTVRTIAEERGGRILVGTLRGLATVTEQRVSRVRIKGLPEPLDVWSIYCESDNTTWIGGSGRLFKTGAGSLEYEVNFGEGVEAEAVQVQCRDRRGRLWVLADGRPAYLSTDGEVAFVASTGDSLRPPIHSIYEDTRGTLWFCGSTGVALLEGDSLRHPTSTESPPITNPVYFVLETSGCRWFGTDHGVLSWDGESARQLTAADGLASDIVRFGWKGEDETLWLGTHGGVSVLDSASVSYVAPVPDIYLDSVLAGDGTQPLKEQSAIPYDDRTVVFRFNALSYIAEREMQFQWMVEGFDRGWQEPRKERQVRYTNLGPGSYIFSVRAANRNGQWSTPAGYAFVIQPPWWRAWWFIALCMMVAGSVLTVAYRFRVEQLLKMERMRRRIAADLHDDIASSLSSVGIYASVIQQQLREIPAEMSVLLDRIRELSRESMENIGLIVWSVDPHRDELTEVFRFFQRYAAQLCQAAGVEFSTKLPEGVTSVLLTPEQRRTIFLVLKESLNNALRHSRCTRIDFVCSLDGHSLRLALTDNGCGFSGTATGGHGLHNMRSRAESIRAHVEVTSAPGGGTTVALTLRIA